MINEDSKPCSGAVGQVSGIVRLSVSDSGSLKKARYVKRMKIFCEVIMGKFSGDGKRIGKGDRWSPAP